MFTMNAEHRGVDSVHSVRKGYIAVRFITSPAALAIRDWTAGTLYLPYAMASTFARSAAHTCVVEPVDFEALALQSLW
jgi:hypothetical protein